MEEVAEEEDSAEMEQETDPPEDILSKDNKKIKGSVYEGETGKEEGYIEFNKKSIVQAVIMSEILQKPKSLER